MNPKSHDWYYFRERYELDFIWIEASKGSTELNCFISLMLDNMNIKKNNHEIALYLRDNV